METKAMEGVAAKLKEFRNSVWFYVAIAVVILIIVLIIRRNINKLKGKFQRDYGDYSDGTPSEISPTRKQYLEQLAADLKEAMEATFPDDTVRVQKMVMADGLPDHELKYLAKYFKNALTRDKSLYYWVDWEWMPGQSADDDLLTHLSKIGEGENS